MLIVSADLLPNYVAYITGASNGLWPLVAVVCGTFLAFAIANKMVYFIQTATKKK